MPGMLPKHEDPRVGDFFNNCRLCIVPVMIAALAIATAISIYDIWLTIIAITCTVVLALVAFYLVFKFNLGARGMDWIESKLP